MENDADAAGIAEWFLWQVWILERRESVRHLVRVLALQFLLWLPVTKYGTGTYRNFLKMLNKRASAYIRKKTANLYTRAVLYRNIILPWNGCSGLTIIIGGGVSKDADRFFPCLN